MVIVVILPKIRPYFLRESVWVCCISKYLEISMCVSLRYAGIIFGYLFVIRLFRVECPDPGAQCRKQSCLSSRIWAARAARSPTLSPSKGFFPNTFLTLRGLGWRFSAFLFCFLFPIFWRGRVWKKYLGYFFTHARLQ